MPKWCLKGLWLPIHQVSGNCPAGIRWRYDTYRSGCAFDCAYCSEKIHNRYNPRVYEGYKSLEAWMKGSYLHSLHSILRFGVLSDPFPDIENTLRRSYKAMYVLAEHYQPVIITTKSTLIASGDYFDILPLLNAVLQVSMVSKDHAGTWENKAPQFRDRFAMLYSLSKRVRRLIVRCQPYMIEYLDDVLKMIPRYAYSGVYGMLVSGISLKHKSGLVNLWHGDGYIYDPDVLRDSMIVIRECCHDHGVQFFTNEFHSYDLSDGSCCGSGGLFG